MPLELSKSQIERFIAEMGHVQSNPNFVYGAIYPKAPTQAYEDVDKQKTFINCWEAVLIAGKNAGFGYTNQMIRDVKKETLSRSKSVMANYVFTYRRFIMFADATRANGYGIPSGLIKPGDIVMSGFGDHVALGLGEELVMEFERNSERRGTRNVNDVDKHYSGSFVMCAPPPAPDDLTLRRPKIVLTGFGEQEAMVLSTL
jgi:hypothetical protein